MKSGMLTIVWDVDDVLNNLMQSWFENTWLRTHPGCNLSYRDIVRNPPGRILGISKSEYLESLDSFRLSKEYSHMKPNESAMCWFFERGRLYRHIALTATPLKTASISAEWVLGHFGKWIRSFSFVPSSRKGEYSPLYDRTKGDYLSWLGKGDVLIDDNMENVEAAKKIGLRTVLMPQPWNNSRQTQAECFGSLLESGM